MTRCWFQERAGTEVGCRHQRRQCYSSRSRSRVRCTCHPSRGQITQFKIRSCRVSYYAFVYYGIKLYLRECSLLVYRQKKINTTKQTRLLAAIPPPHDGSAFCLSSVKFLKRTTHALSFNCKTVPEH